MASAHTSETDFDGESVRSNPGIADWAQLHRQLDAYLAACLTKFVIRPALQANIDDFIDRFVAELVPRQN